MAHEEDGTSGSTATSVFRLVPAVVLLVVLLIFAIFNSQKTTVDLVITETTAPLSLVLLVTAIVGALIALLVRFERRRL